MDPLQLLKVFQAPEAPGWELPSHMAFKPVSCLTSGDHESSEMSHPRPTRTLLIVCLSVSGQGRGEEGRVRRVLSTVTVTPPGFTARGPVCTRLAGWSRDIPRTLLQTVPCSVTGQRPFEPRMPWRGCAELSGVSVSPQTRARERQTRRKRTWKAGGRERAAEGGERGRVGEGGEKRGGSVSADKRKVTVTTSQSPQQHRVTSRGTGAFTRLLDGAG